MRLFIPISFVSIMIACNSSSAEQSGSFISNDTCFYSVTCPPDIDMPQTPHYDTTIARSGNCKVKALRLASWGTETSYALFPADSTVKMPDVKLNVHFFHGQAGVIDITDIPPGRYNVSLSACGNGGSFGLTIK
jgi:hypothetical protein